ncbi:MAG: sulfotransferase family protein [Acidimicrobiales bacterium]
MDLPDFLGIGALKAGTSYLDAMLRGHPEVGLPPAVKEVEFFNRHFDRGSEWYTRQFRGAEDRVRGEISPQYLFDARAAGRIRDLVPDVRLIVSVRNPVERAYSQYKHWAQETAYRGSFEDFLTDHPGAVARGRYLPQLRPYLDRFSREQILVIVFEELVGRPDTMAAVYRFIGADPQYREEPSGQKGRSSPPPQPPRAAQAVNVSAPPRFHGSYVASKRVSRWIQDRGGTRIIAAAKRAGIDRVFGSKGEGPAFAPLLPDTARRLADTYAGDVDALSRFLGRDLGPMWSTT